MDKLPLEFIRRIQDTFGDNGDAWLEKFPQTLIGYAQNWNLDILPHIEHLSYNFVAPVRREDRGEAILKLGVPNHEITSEIAALRIYDGRGAARLLEADANGGAMLLEYVRPGVPLLEVSDDDKATEVAALTMQKLWRPISNIPGLISIEDWSMGFKRLRQHYQGGTGPFPKRLVEQAESLFPELIKSTEKTVLLHGDLHHWNILSARRQPWLAIDPKGILGDPAFEVAAWMKNPITILNDWPNLEKVLARRLDQFSEILGFERERLLKWSLAQTVLSAWWNVEGNEKSMEMDMRVSHVLSSLLNK